MTFLVFLLVASRSLLGVFLPRKIITSMKNSCKFQASVTEKCTFLSKRSGMLLLKVPVKKWNL